jgi:TonB family protein
VQLPTPDQYQTVLQNPQIAFAGNPDLERTRPELTRSQMPRPYSGNFTATFHLQGDREWAVRCYTREVRDVVERYRAITRFLETNPDPSLTIAKLVHAGILVNAERYDIIQMEWISGRQLNQHIKAVVAQNPSELGHLADAVWDLGLRFEHLGIAHGDLQHGNILVDGLGAIRLVDYDDMFLPELRHLQFSSGLGQENYQHPNRQSTSYDEKLDRFAVIVIYLTLKALSAKPSLWQTFDGGEDCLLFRKADFLDPHGSRLFQEMDRLTPVKELVDRFASVCVGSYEEIPSLADFLDGRFVYSRFVPRAVANRVPDSPPDLPATPFARPPSGGDRPPTPIPAISAFPSAGTVPAAPLHQRSQSKVVLAVLLTVGSVIFVAIFALAYFGNRGGFQQQTAYAPARPIARSQVTHAAQAAAPTHQIIIGTPQPAKTAVRKPPDRTSQVIASPAKTAATSSTSPVLSATATQALPVPTNESAPVAAPERQTCTTPDSPTRLATLAAPHLSSAALTAAAGKSVVVSVDLAADGTVTDAEVKVSSGEPSLDFAALDAARRSSYTVAEHSCSAASGSVDVTVSY